MFLGAMAACECARLAGLTAIAADVVAPGLAAAVGGVLSVAYADMGVDGNVLAMPGHALRVTEACTGFEIVGVLTTAILAYPTQWRRRVVGAAMVVPFVALLNVTRVTTLALVLRHAPAAFDVCHSVVWQGILVLSALAYWVVWSHADRADGAMGTVRA